MPSLRPRVKTYSFQTLIGDIPFISSRPCHETAVVGGKNVTYIVDNISFIASLPGPWMDGLMDGW